MLGGRMKIYVCLVLFGVYGVIWYINVQNKLRNVNLLRELKKWQMKEGNGIYLIYGSEVDGVLGDCKGRTLLLNKGLYIMKGRYSNCRKLFIVEADDGSGKVGLYDISLDGKIICRYENVKLSGMFWGEISPDGRKFLFFGRDGNSGGERMLILNMESGNVSAISLCGKFPVWCGNEKIVCVEEKSEGLGVIKLYDLRTGGIKNLCSGNMVSGAPDGNYIAYRDGDLNFYQMVVKSREKRYLFAGKDILTPLRWSFDSKYLLYVRDTPDFFCGLFFNFEKVNVNFLNFYELIHRFGTIGMEPKDVMIYSIDKGFSVKVGEVYKSMPLDFVFVKDRVLYKKICEGL